MHLAHVLAFHLDISLKIVTLLELAAVAFLDWVVVANAADALSIVNNASKSRLKKEAEGRAGWHTLANHMVYSYVLCSENVLN